MGYRQFNSTREAYTILNSFYDGIDHSKINSIKDNSGEICRGSDKRKSRPGRTPNLYLNFHANKRGKKDSCMSRLYNTNNKNRNYEASTNDRRQSGYTRRNCWKV
jgi:hypothetical protein